MNKNKINHNCKCLLHVVTGMHLIGNFTSACQVTDYKDPSLKSKSIVTLSFLNVH